MARAIANTATLSTALMARATADTAIRPTARTRAMAILLMALTAQAIANMVIQSMALMGQVAKSSATQLNAHPSWGCGSTMPSDVGRKHN
jgi:hypothetical protein